MQHRRLYVLLATAGFLLVGVSAIALALPQTAQAQCGSQASSCKNCHEVQGKDPVNADGTSWHQAHAFGDFCYICHGGNNQATDETAAHAGMVSPLADIKASCQQCHPNDLQARAEVYAKALGVQIGSGAAATAAPAQGTAAPTATPAAAAQSSSAEPLAPAAANNADLVNYVERYDENALGKQPANWGNVILLVLIGVMAVGGGSMVVTHEGLIRVSFKETKPITGEYPQDVVDLVPDLAKLKPSARKSLGHLLKKPAATNDLLNAVDRLSSDEDTP